LGGNYNKRSIIGEVLVDSVVSVVSIVVATIVDGLQKIDKTDVVALLVCFVVGATAIVLRDRADGWRTRYINRFVRRGLRRIAAHYAISLAVVLLASAFALVELRNLLPDMVQAVIGAGTVAVAIVLSVLGWQARGPSQPDFFRFTRIFYEPAAVALSPIVVPKWSTIIEKAPFLWRQVADITFGFMG
jgi:hypothetical protein